MANSASQLFTIAKRLPPEIMSDIFISCNPLMTHNPRHVDFQDGISIPLTLSSVCRLWRRIAHSTPALWTSFRIYIPSRDLPQCIQHAQHWLSHSGQLPLSIQILPHPSVYLDVSDPLIVELINLINTYSHRWEILEIGVASKLLHRFDGLSKSTSILKSLHLSPVDFYRDPGTFHTGASNPSPTSVVLSPSYVWPLAICWNNVTHFTALCIEVGQVLEILRLSPQLQRCFLDGLWIGDDDTPVPGPSPHLLHACLETLDVGRCFEEPVPNQLLDNIKLPSLRNFNYRGGKISLPLANSMIAFLNRSGCSLKTFSLRQTIISQEVLMRLLFSMPHLEALTLGPKPSNNPPYIAHKVLNALADTAEISSRPNDQLDGPFLPKLRSLKYIGRPTGFSWECIPIVFGRRTKEPGAFESPICHRRPFHSLRLELIVDSHLDWGPKADVVAELKRLRAEEGYEIEILDVSYAGHHDLLREEWDVN